MPPQGSAYRTDWILSNASNAHVANHRDWFTTFNEFPSHIAAMPGGPATIGVRGVGTVVLETRTRRKPQTITLDNVLYVPSCTTNIFAFCQQDTYTVEWPGGSSSIKISTGKVVGLVVNGKLPRIWLKGLSESQSSLDPNGIYYINASWPASERARWEEHRRSSDSSSVSAIANASARSATLPSLTDAEKKFLKDHYGNEFKFLQQHGLRIHDVEQCAEGRDVLKAMMAADEDIDDDDESDVDSEDSGERFLRDLEEDPMSHVADYQFSEKELDWIGKHYRHSGQFMLSYRLKPFDDEDCKEAAHIVRSMIGP